MSNLILRSPSPIDSLIEQTLNLVKATSARVYQQTYNVWKDWCHNQSVDPLDFRPSIVNAFLESQHVTRATRKRQLSAIRKLAASLWVLTGSDDANRMYTALKMTSASENNLSDVTRSRHALNPTEAYKVLAVWSGDTLLHKRNHALIAFLAMTGVRRSEAAVLKWTDIDFENGVATVLGKGNKLREVSIFGQVALTALKQWHDALPDRTYVFPAFDHKQNVKDDAPIDGQTVFRVVKRTERLSGVAFSPHTMRRTLITEALFGGAPIADVQAQAGHSNEATTLRYARPVNAKDRRSRVKLRYGD